MFIVVVRVVALALLVLGLWHLGNVFVLADKHYWHYFTEPAATANEITANEITANEIIVDGFPVPDPKKYLIERGSYGGAVTIIALGFVYIAERVARKMA